MELELQLQNGTLKLHLHVNSVGDAGSVILEALMRVLLAARAYYLNVMSAMSLNVHVACPSPTATIRKATTLGLCCGTITRD